VENLLDLQLTRRLEVGAFAARAGDDLPLFVGEQAHGFRASRVYPYDIWHSGVQERFRGAAAAPAPAADRKA